MLRRRRAAQINRQSVPYGSAKVEYLESTGTQYLFKGVQAVEYSTLKSEWVSQFTSLAERHFFGYTGTAFHGINWGGNWNFGLGVANLEKHLFWMELNKSSGLSARIDTGRIHKESYFRDQVAFCPFSIGGEFASSLKCYSAKTWKDNAPIIDFVPCLDTTGAPCMFDLVSRKNFYNAGTGQFSYPYKNDIPSNYTSLDYLESTGTQWIDTKQLLKSNNFQFSICDRLCPTWE